MKKRAFMFVELLIVLLIIGFLSGSLLKAYFGDSSKEVAESVLADLSVLKDAARAFEEDNEEKDPETFWPSALDDASVSSAEKSLNLLIPYLSSAHLCQKLVPDGAGQMPYVFCGGRGENRFKTLYVGIRLHAGNSVLPGLKRRLHAVAEEEKLLNAAMEPYHYEDLVLVKIPMNWRGGI